MAPRGCGRRRLDRLRDAQRWAPRASAVAAATSANGSCAASPSRNGADTTSSQCSCPSCTYRSMNSCSTNAAGASAATSRSACRDLCRALGTR